jgi:hypothetical protein
LGKYFHHQPSYTPADKIIFTIGPNYGPAEKSPVKIRTGGENRIIIADILPPIPKLAVKMD